MSRPNLMKLLEDQAEPSPPPQQEPAATAVRREPTARAGKPTPRSASARVVHKPGEVNISAYFPPEVKAALRQVQAKTGKNIKACLSEALQLLFRKHNVPVTVSEE